jgi:hypothetical protein
MSSAVAFHAGQLARNLLAGARLALLLPLRARSYRASAGQLALLVLVNFVLWLAAAGVRSHFEGDFDPTALSVYLASVAMTLATAFLVAWAYRALERLLLFAVAFSASDALFYVSWMAFIAAGAAEYNPKLLDLAYMLWPWLASLRAAVVCGGWRWPRVVLAWLAVTVTAAAALYVIPDADVWQLPDDDEDQLEAHFPSTTPGQDSCPRT